MLVFRFRIFARNVAALEFVLSFSAAELDCAADVRIKREAGEAKGVISHF
jgi:hypothetical protein